MLMISYFLVNIMEIIARDVLQITIYF